MKYFSSVEISYRFDTVWRCFMYLSQIVLFIIFRIFVMGFMSKLKFLFVMITFLHGITLLSMDDSPCSPIAPRSFCFGSSSSAAFNLNDLYSPSASSASSSSSASTSSSFAFSESSSDDSIFSPSGLPSCSSISSVSSASSSSSINLSDFHLLRASSRSLSFSSTSSSDSMDSSSSGSTSCSSSSSSSLRSGISSTSKNAVIAQELESLVGNNKGWTPTKTAETIEGLRSVQYSASRSDRSIARYVATAAISSLKSSPTVDSRVSAKRGVIPHDQSPSVVNNAEQLKMYRDSTSTLKKKRRMDVVGKAVEIGNLEEEFSVVDTLHSVQPEIKRNKEGRITGVAGGHARESYFSVDLHERCFVSASNAHSPIRTEGVYVGEVPKTVESGFNHKRVLDIAKRSRRIAEGGELNVLKTPENLFYGAYFSAKNSLIKTTMFPLLVVDRLNHACASSSSSSAASSSSSSSDVEIGSFGTFSPDRKTITPTKRVTVTQDAFAQMITNGQRLTSDPNFDAQVTDISEPVLNHVRSDLDGYGLKKFFPVFAITPKN